MEPRHPQAGIDAIARAVNAEITRRGFSVTFTAELAGVDKSVLCRWLNGKRNTSAATAAKVLDALDLAIRPGTTAVVVHKHNRECACRECRPQHTPG